MVLGIAPFEPMAMVTPFTTRDNMSYLQILSALRDKVNEDIANTNIVYTDLSDYVNKAFDDLGIQWNDELLVVRNEVISQVNTPGTPAYEAVVGAAGAVYDPATADLVSAPASATHDALATLAAALMADPASGVRSALSDVLPHFNIRDYGASTATTPEAIAANRTAIQAAINAAQAVGGGVVWVPAGTYNVKAVQTVTGSENGRTFNLPNVPISIVGEDRVLSVIRVHESSADWAYLFAYKNGEPCNKLTVRNITIDGGTNTTPTGTANDWNKARTLFNLIGADITIEDCNLICSGIWAVKHVGDNVRIRNNNITMNLSWYSFGFFDISAIWFFSQNGIVEDNVITTIEASNQPFVVQSGIEFQGHRNTVRNNKTAPGSRLRNGLLFTASTYYDGLLGYYPASPKGASDNTISGNAMTVTRYGVEIWGMVIPSPLPLKGNRIINNAFSVMNSVNLTSPCGGVNIYTGTAGATGHDGVQTSGITDLKISNNTVTFDTRRISTVTTTADCGVRLNVVTPCNDIEVSGNVVTNSGGYGVCANVLDTSTEWLNGVDIVGNNLFVDCREPVRIGRNVNNWRVEGNTFKQTQIFATLLDNMIECVNSRAADFPTEVGGILRRNTVRVQPTHKPFLPSQDRNLAQAYFPASRGYIVEIMEPRIQEPGKTITMGGTNVVRRASDGVLVKPQFTAGATLGTLTGVTIGSVIDSSTMTVNDATNIEPGQVLGLAFNAPFASGSCVVVAVVGNTIKTGANQLAAAAGHTWAEAVGLGVSYYGAVVNA